MLTNAPSATRIALSRATFGARDVDINRVEQLGWAQWVEDQLNPPLGDDPIVGAIVGSAILPIAYNAYSGGTWPAVNEDRPLKTLGMSWSQLYDIAYKAGTNALPAAEIDRAADEAMLGTWLRNAHSRFQVREVIVDFWHRHFNVWRYKSNIVRYGLSGFDRLAIRANAFGNFRELVESVAKAPPMLYYLDNADSRAGRPNENYARELLELHTIGITGYLGVAGKAGDAATGGVQGFTDTDILHASRALSGWTVATGQRVGQGKLPNTGEFHFEPSFHNTTAESFMGSSLSDLQPKSAEAAPLAVAQGERVIEIAARHRLTAEFVIGKLFNRLIGRQPEKATLELVNTVWMDNQDSPNQIREVLRAILMSEEFKQPPMQKLRRPYERALALVRATNAQLVCGTALLSTFKQLRDIAFAWPTPDGWPDTNDYWNSTSVAIADWNFLIKLIASSAVKANLVNETLEVKTVEGLLDQWIGRVVGYQLHPDGYQALRGWAGKSSSIRAFLDSGNAAGSGAESGLRSLVALIATAPEFAYR